jgi:hypothetical protein
MRGGNSKRPSKVEANDLSNVEELIRGETLTELPPKVANLIKNLSPLRTQRVKSSENNYVLVSLSSFNVLALLGQVANMRP